NTGRTTNAIRTTGRGPTFEYLVGDAARLHPGREDHIQIPWFQCVDDYCEYHFKEKFSHDHWPMRSNNAQGYPKPIPWTYDQGLAAEQWLWEVNQVRRDEEFSTIRAKPRWAWPVICETNFGTEQCPTKHCLYHLRDKLREFHKKDNRMTRP